jgi:DNA-binding CsgD family transcriptional regulator
MSWRHSRCCARKLSEVEIVARLYVARRTINHHVSTIPRRLGVNGPGQTATEATRLGL